MSEKLYGTLSIVFAALCLLAAFIGLLFVVLGMASERHSDRFNRLNTLCIVIAVTSAVLLLLTIAGQALYKLHMYH